MKQESSQLPDLESAYMRELLNSSSRKKFVAAVRLALRQVLASIHVEGHYDQVITAVKRDPCYQDLNNRWEKLDLQSKGRKWQELMEKLVQIAYASRPYCMRCGECCRQGSPSLHLEDAELLSQGLISTRQVYTLRQGEAVRNNIEARPDTLAAELIKIKQDPESRHCIFYEENNRSCLIYHYRPLQCRLQKCWNPMLLKRLWDRVKLSRRHLLEDDHDLLELLQAHDERCALEKLDAAYQKLYRAGDSTALDQITNMLSQDAAFRNFFRTKLARDNEELEFLLGRPLAEIVRVYGMKVEEDGDGVYHLIQDR